LFCFQENAGGTFQPEAGGTLGLGSLQQQLTVQTKKAQSAETGKFFEFKYF